MGTLLKVLTIIVFVLSIFAFVLGLANFNKRELLIGRTHALEQAFISLGSTLEASDPEADNVPDHTEWDEDEVTDRELTAPAMSDFWSSYEDKLELSAQEMLNLGTQSKKDQLAHYYRLDSEGKIMKNGQGRPIKDGPGTMAELVDSTIDRAKSQLALLNKTRNQLTVVREKLDEVAGLLNEQKKLRRDNLITIKELNGKIEELNDTIVKKDGEIARVTRERDELNDQVSSLNDTIAQKDQEISNFTAEIARLKEEVKRLTVDVSADRSTNRATGAAAVEISLAPGKKGTVSRVENGFVIIKLTEEALAEIAPAGTAFQPLEMMVYRGYDAATQTGTIVTRLKISNPPSKSGLAVADNVYGWEQTPVQVGDDVIY